MDRRLWQEHLVMCSRLIVKQAKLYSTHFGLASTILTNSHHCYDVTETEEQWGIYYLLAHVMTFMLTHQSHSLEFNDIYM